MFKNIISKVRGLLYKMGLIKGIKKITQHKNIIADDEFYDRMNIWHVLYKGYYEEWHKVKYHTIESGEQTRRMHTLNMPKVLSEEMAKLIFNEKCEINISDGGLKEKIDKVLKDNKFYHQFQRYLEYMFALGGMAIKVYADENDKICIGFVSADCFIPIRQNNSDIQEGLFVNQSKKAMNGKNIYYTLLEWHTWENGDYVISNELYKSEMCGEIGYKTSLAELYPSLAETVTIKDIKRPLFIYSKPNVANNFDTQSPLGISIYANCLDTIKALDVAFDSFMREFKLGKKRIIVPQSAVKTVIDPITGSPRRYFDANDEVYEALNFEMDSTAKNIQDISVELRVEEHISAIQAFLDILSMQVGFSAGTFTFDGKGVKTATEVISENSKTFRTMTSHESLVEEAIRDLVRAIVDVAALYKIFTVTEDFEVNVDFDDSIIEDTEAVAKRAMLELNSGIIDKVIYYQRVYKYTKEQAVDLVAEIEARSPPPDEGDFIPGGDGDE
ncbi:phage portal protein [Alkalibaculum sp. M08DMB]|uniref:Phage portal protein n=1 Tax=Alkalibaculum sporogenes TaxID=2655001 RepID=A0A6A7KAD1_9FIRM|nr:phage portal protein [Alkalibaculum sporogenes]MPW26251.1 phage portal protein [Alkalibaculum sporogenes]